MPEAGWYKTRLVKGGPWAPARIWIEREIDPETGELANDERFRCEIDGMLKSAETWWLHLTPISRLEHEELRNMRTSIPEMAATKATIDLTTTIVRPT